MQERYQDVVEIPGFDGKVIEMLIDYMYGEEILIDSDNVIEVLAAADYLQLNDVKNFCIDYLQEGLTVDICLDALIAYDVYQQTSSMDYIYNFIYTNFEAISSQEKLKHLSKTQLASLLSEMTAKRANQEHLFAAILNWIGKDEEARKIYFVELFQLMKLENLTCKYLEKNIMANDFVKESITCVNAVLTVFSKKFRDDSKIIRLGGMEYRSIKKSVTEVHNILGKTATKYPDLPVAMHGHSALKVANFIYCLGGVNEHYTNAATSDVYRMDLCSNPMKWEKIVSMKVKRSLQASAEVNGNIIVTGGCYQKHAMNSAELYDCQLDDWRLLPPMNYPREGHALVAYGQRLVVVGGGTETRPLSSVEMLSEVQGEWLSLNSMNTARYRLAAVVCDGKVYAIGGKFLSSIEASVEKYDFDTNTWSNVCSMKNPRWKHSACVFRGRIFVV